MMSQSNAVDNFLAENKNLAAMMIFIDPKDPPEKIFFVKGIGNYYLDL